MNKTLSNPTANLLNSLFLLFDVSFRGRPKKFFLFRLAYSPPISNTGDVGKEPCYIVYR